MPVSVVRGHRLAALQSVAGTMWLAAALSSAQEVDTGLEQIIVTGTRIARPDFESASPIVSVTTDAFVRTSSTSVDTVVSQSAAVHAGHDQHVEQPVEWRPGKPAAARAWSTSTLVLLDGRRIVPANGNGVVDVNVVPATLIESVEVISGGASAVYGSDAIAGVVNFKLRNDFDGLQFDGGLGPDRPRGRVGVLSRRDGGPFVCGRSRRGLRVRRLLGARRGFSGRAGVFRSDAGLRGTRTRGGGRDGGFVPQGSITFIAEGRTLRAGLQLPSRLPVAT